MSGQAVVTPLPRAKIAILGMMLAANNCSIWLIFTILPFMVEHYFPLLDVKELGFRAGILGSAFHFGSLLGNFMWGVIADRIGRRPALICGLTGTVFSALIFAFAPTFTIAVLARFAWGFLNGNVGVSKTYMAEILDDSNTARGMAMFGVIGGVGRTVGPILGGFLSTPSEGYPYLFKGTVFDTFPFALPNVVLAFVCAVVCVLGYFFLPETLRISAHTGSNSKNRSSSHRARSNEGSKSSSISRSTQRAAAMLVGSVGGGQAYSPLQMQEEMDSSGHDAKSSNKDATSSTLSGLHVGSNNKPIIAPSSGTASISFTTNSSSSSLRPVDEAIFSPPSSSSAANGNRQHSLSLDSNGSYDEEQGGLHSPDICSPIGDDTPLLPGVRSPLHVNAQAKNAKRKKDLFSSPGDDDENEEEEEGERGRVVDEEQGRGGANKKKYLGILRTPKKHNEGAAGMKRRVGFSNLVMFKVIGSNSMAYGQLKKIRNDDVPVSTPPGYHQEQQQQQQQQQQQKKLGGYTRKGATGSREEEEEEREEGRRDDDDDEEEVQEEEDEEVEEREREAKEDRSEEFDEEDDDGQQDITSPMSFFSAKQAKQKQSPPVSLNPEIPAHRLRYSNGSEFNISAAKSQKSLCASLSYLMSRREVVLSTVLYGLNAFVQLLSIEVFPLWVVTDPADGGFGYNARVIGLASMISGPFAIIAQLYLYPALVEKFGVLFVYKFGAFLYAVTAMLIPAVSLSLQLKNPTLTWILVCFGLISLNTAGTWVLVCVFTLINNSCYSHQRATVNGIGQTFASIGRLSAPYLGASLFAWSEVNGLAWPLNYSLTWYLIGSLSFLASQCGKGFSRSIQRRKREPKEPRYATSMLVGRDEEDDEEFEEEVEEEEQEPEQDSPPSSSASRRKSREGRNSKTNVDLIDEGVELIHR